MRFLMILTVILTLSLLLTNQVLAAEIQLIHFQANALTVEHSGCQLKPLIRERHKLIIPLVNCLSKSASQMTLQHPMVKKIHWAQHDKNIVWVVISLAENYTFSKTVDTKQLTLCFPECNYTNISYLAHKSQITLFTHKGIKFNMPLQNMSIEEFIDKSIGYLPKDVIRDGLPQFGSWRDDWLGKKRLHKGYDIYTNNINVLAMADGEVVTVSPGGLSGLYIKIKHDQDIYTLYVHLTSTQVKVGEQVTSGQIIGRIDGAAGNAVEAQLHIELKPDNVSIDPLPLIAEYYQHDAKITAQIQTYTQLLPERTTMREKLLQQFLRK
jgi:hypothetical protein